MRSVVQLHPQSGAAALGPLAEGLAAADRARLAQALEFAEPLYGEATLSTGNVDAANPVVGPDASHEFSDTVKGDRGLAMALAGNGRWTYLDPKLGAMHAVAEAARKVACTGATPVAATNCLNFGNPEKPEIMAQLSQAIDGIAEACNALGTPVTGGNVSLYNETKGEGIYPTPVLGIVGIIEDVTKSVPAARSTVTPTSIPGTSRNVSGPPKPPALVTSQSGAPSRRMSCTWDVA